MMLASVLFALLGCFGASCEEDGTTHVSGESWTCSDGCNTCSCEDGAIASTLMGCEAVTCGEGAHEVGDTWECGCNTCTCDEDGSIISTDQECAECTDATGSYFVGDSWTCPDGCNTCSCEADGSIVSTDMACE